MKFLGMSDNQCSEYQDATQHRTTSFEICISSRQDEEVETSLVVQAAFQRYKLCEQEVHRLRTLLAQVPHPPHTD